MASRNPPPSNLKASYQSPTGLQKFSHSIASPSAREPTSKAAYLGDLRLKTNTMQDEINHFLTTKMEEDKTVSAAATTNGKPRDVQEEEDYGEQKVDQD